MPETNLFNRKELMDEFEKHHQYMDLNKNSDQMYLNVNTYTAFRTFERGAIFVLLKQSMEPRKDEVKKYEFNAPLAASELG